MKPARMDCPDDVVLLEHAEGRVASARLGDALEEHLDGCSMCREIVAEVARAASPVDASSEPPPSAIPAPPPGARLGRYTLLHQLGSGGMGVVYAAHDARLDRRVALKLLRRDLALRAPHVKARLLREAQTIARLTHPNVVTVFDAAVIDDDVVIAMELVTGGTLSALLRARRPGMRALLDLFVQAGQGLAAAHEAGIVHRDFKPDNVLVTEGGRALVSDFGLARITIDEPLSRPPEGEVDAMAMTRTGARLGTPAYMAPEQHAGLATDARTDQFSFCVALHEALYGERPFVGSTLEALAQAVSRGEVRPAPRDRACPLGCGAPCCAGSRSIRGRAIRRCGAPRRARSDEARLDRRGDRGRHRRRRGGRHRRRDGPAADGSGREVRRVGRADRRRVERRARRRHRGAARRPRGAVRGLRVGARARGPRRLRCELVSRARRRLPRDARARRAIAASARSAHGVPRSSPRSAPEHRERPRERRPARRDAPRRDRDLGRGRELVQRRGARRADGAARRRADSAAPRRGRVTPRARAPQRRGQAPRSARFDQEAVALADRAGFAPLRAQALLARGVLEDSNGDPKSAESTLHEAAWGAEACHADHVAAAAWARLVSVIAYRQTRKAEAPRLARQAEAAITRAFGDDEARIVLLEALANIAKDSLETEEARALRGGARGDRARPWPR